MKYWEWDFGYFIETETYHYWTASGVGYYFKKLNDPK